MPRVENLSMSQNGSESDDFPLRPFLAAVCLGLSLFLSAAGCRAPETQASREAVSVDLVERFDTGIGEESEPGESAIPFGVSLDDGVTADEAVQVALWNNAALQATLTELGVSSAQLLDAGLLRDPQFNIFFPLGPKQLEFTTFQAVDAIWLQPIRVRAAELDLDRVSQSMTQNGLDVIRDVRVAHTDLLLATAQQKVSREAAELRNEIASLANKRLAAGDISELEVTASRIDAFQAQAAADRTVSDVTLARERLRIQLGLTMFNGELEAIADSEFIAPERSTGDLVSEALAMRPDLRAAEIAVEVAGERAGLARKQFMNLDAVYDANGSGKRGFESGPGLQFTVPVLNRNQGGIAIADAQWQQAVRQYVAVRDRVALEVRTAYTQLNQARENLKTVREQILPALQDAEELARLNFEHGATPYFMVLQTTGQYLDARVRELQLMADQRRAIADLERSVGTKLAVQLNSSADRIELPEITTAARVDRSPTDRHARNTGWHATASEHSEEQRR